jgi:hypothetical protein
MARTTNGRGRKQDTAGGKGKGKATVQGEAPRRGRPPKSTVANGKAVAKVDRTNPLTALVEDVKPFNEMIAAKIKEFGDDKAGYQAWLQERVDKGRAKRASGTEAASSVKPTPVDPKELWRSKPATSEAWEFVEAYRKLAIRHIQGHSFTETKRTRHDTIVSLAALDRTMRNMSLRVYLTEGEKKTLEDNEPFADLLSSYKAEPKAKKSTVAAEE